MDSIVPLHTKMGLLIENSGILASIFQREVSDVEQGREPISTVIPNLKLNIIKHFGEAGLRFFLTWSQTVFGNPRGWTEWRLLSEVADPSFYQSISLPPNAVSIGNVLLWEKYCEQCFEWEQDADDRVAILLGDIRKQPLSDWDKQFLKRINASNNAVDIDTLPDTTDALFYVRQAISMNRFQGGWEKFWSARRS